MNKKSVKIYRVEEAICSPVGSTDSEIAIIRANSSNDSQLRKMCNIAKSLEKGNVFSIAIIVADNSTWELNKELTPSYGTWTVADSSLNADKVENDICRIIETNGLIDLDVNDFISLLKGERFYYASADGDKFEDVMGTIETEAKKQGKNIFDSKKILMSICIKDDVTIEEMNRINDFLEGFHDNFECKWGLIELPVSSSSSVRVVVLAIL